MPQFAISSWSVHGLLGKAHFKQENGKTVIGSGQAEGEITLLELPALLKKAGCGILEICHFHLPSIEEDYLQQLKQVLDDNSVTLENILIDAGNLSNPNESERLADIEMAKRWQRIAAQLGGKGNRIDCGTEPPTAKAIDRAVHSLSVLVEHANSLKLHVTTENFRQTSQEADNLLEIMNKVRYPIKLCLDFGNAEKTADKFGTIEKLMPYGTSIHCKANYVNGEIDLDDLHKSLSYLKHSNFDGPITLIYDQTEDEWTHILALQSAIKMYGI